MEAQLFGHIEKPAVVLVGSWDPLLPEFRGLIQELISHGRQHNQASLAILLDPPPQGFLKGIANWPIYMGPRARIHFLQAEGLDGVLHIDFQKEDLHSGVADLLDLVRAHVPVAEVWMRYAQKFGRGPRGSPYALAIYAKKHQLTWKSVPNLGVKPLAYEVQQHLKRGCVAEAAAVVGLPSIWGRPRSGTLRFAWSSGTYQAVPLQHPDAPLDADPISVDLDVDAEGLSCLSWPAPHIEYLAFVAGPGALSGDGASLELAQPKATASS